MKLLSTRTHAVLDYLMGSLLIASPWIFNFANSGLAQRIPVTLGIITIIMSLFTKYERSFFKVIGMRTHLVIDFLSGLFLAISPWLFGFSELVYLPHLIAGILEIIVVLLSDNAPFIAAVEQEKYGKLQDYSKKSV